LLLCNPLPALWCLEYLRLVETFRILIRLLSETD